ncbi:hypothetical protein [Pseudomonas sp. H3_H05]
MTGLPFADMKIGRYRRQQADGHELRGNQHERGKRHGKYRAPGGPVLWQ